MCSLSEMKFKLNAMKSLCKSLDKIKCILNQNNSVLFSGIECENNDYLWHSLTIDLNLCKISDKMLSNHNTTHTLNTYLNCFWPKCPFKTQYKSELIIHQFKHSVIRRFKCDFYNCDKCYTHYSDLIKHKNSIHLNERIV